MAVFYNRATLSYGNTTLPSNITEGELISGIGGVKTALNSSYTKDEGIAYSVLISNTGAAVSGITVSDDLGAYQIAGGLSTVVPLEYIAGSVMLYIDGVPAAAPTVTAGTGVVFSNISLPANSSALLIYEASVNEYAPLAAGSVITNTVTVTDTTITESATSSATVPVRLYTELTVAKALCPAVITENSEVSYTFIIQNLGNLAASGNDLVLADTFSPILTNIAVTLNGEPLAETAYTYNEATGEFATAPGALEVPAATFTQSEVGVISATPGVTTITVTGTI